MALFGESVHLRPNQYPQRGGVTDLVAPTTTGSNSTLGGTQILANLAAPVTVQGNAISVGGGSKSEGATNASSTPGGATASVASTTTGTDSFLGGTQVVPLTLLGTDSSARGTGNSSVAALRLTPLFGSTLAGSTLASTGTTPLPFLALGLLFALAGLGLAGRGLIARGLIARGGGTA